MPELTQATTTNPNAVDIEELDEETSIPRWRLVRFITAAQHDAEIPAGMAYSSYEYRHEAPDKIGVHRGGKAITFANGDGGA